jgi:protein TIF31
MGKLLGNVVCTVSESYNLREARIHVKHIRDLLKSLDSQDAYNGVDCSSLSFLNSIIGAELGVLGRLTVLFCIFICLLSFENAAVNHDGVVTDVRTEKKVRMETAVDCQPPEFILPGCKDRPIVPLHSVFKDTQVRA